MIIGIEGLTDMKSIINRDKQIWEIDNGCKTSISYTTTSSWRTGTPVFSTRTIILKPRRHYKIEVYIEKEIIQTKNNIITPNIYF